MTRQRDSQQGKVFASYAFLKEFSRTLQPSEVEREVKRVLARAYIVKRYPQATMRLVIKQMAGYPKGRSHWLSYPDKPITQVSLAYAIAQVIWYRRHFYSDQPYHGWQFAAIFLDVVRIMYGVPLHDLLRAKMKLLRARFAAKRSRVMTPEMLENLKLAREKRSASGE